MKSIYLIIAALGCLISAPCSAWGQAAGPTPEIPELSALSGFVGRWESRFHAKPIEGITEGGTRKGTASAEWILDGRFLQQKWTLEASGEEPKLSGSTIMTYDPIKKGYRAWFFVSNGSTSTGEGNYDETSKTITWTSRDADNFVTVTKSSFAKDGSEVWTITVNDGGGRLLADLNGKNTRLN